MSKTEKLDGCEFVGARMLRNLQGKEKEDLVGAEENSFIESGTGHGTLETGHSKKKSGPARFELATYALGEHRSNPFQVFPESLNFQFKTSCSLFAKFRTAKFLAKQI